VQRKIPRQFRTQTRRPEGSSPAQPKVIPGTHAAWLCCLTSVTEHRPSRCGVRGLLAMRRTHLHVYAGRPGGKPHANRASSSCAPQRKWPRQPRAHTSPLLSQPNDLPAMHAALLCCFTSVTEHDPRRCVRSSHDCLAASCPRCASMLASDAYPCTRVTCM